MVLVTPAAAAPGAVPAPFSARIPSGCAEAFIRENAIEWYASWFVGKAPDIGYRGVLPGSSEAEARRSLREIGRAEAGSRIVVDYGELARTVDGMRRRGRKIVFTNGVFDLLHAGHLRLLEQARALGDALIVAINSDDSTRRLKGAGRPVVPQFARAGLLAGLRQVDVCFIFPEPDPLRALQTIRPDLLAKGSDYTLPQIVGAPFVTGYGGKVVRLPIVAGWSTTSLISGIRGAR